MPKLFKDVQPGENIYILDPKPLEIDPKVKQSDFNNNPTKYIKHQIIECEVTKVAPHPKSRGEQVWLVKFFVPTRLPHLLTPELMKRAKESRVENIEETLMISSKDHLVGLTNIRPFPTVCSTTREAIEQWMLKTK